MAITRVNLRPSRPGHAGSPKAPTASGDPVAPPLSDATGSEPDQANSPSQQSSTTGRGTGTTRRKRPPAAGDKQHFSLKRLAHLWDVSLRTLRRLIDDGELRATKIRGQLRVTQAEVLDYEARHWR